MIDHYYIGYKADDKYNERRSFFRAYDQANADILLTGQKNVVGITAEPTILLITDEFVLDNLQGPYERYVRLYKEAEEERNKPKEPTPAPEPVSGLDDNGHWRDYENYPSHLYRVQAQQEMETFDEYVANLKQSIATNRDPKTLAAYEERYSDYQGSNPVPPSPVSELNKRIKRIVFGNAETFLALMPGAQGFRFDSDYAGTVYLDKEFVDANSRPAYLPTYKERLAQSAGTNPDGPQLAKA